MAYPDLTSVFYLLGYRMKDRITGLTGVVTSISFDLYGCVQACLHPGLDKEGKVFELHWYDVGRLENVSDERVMAPPGFGDALAGAYDSGPETKPHPRAV